jgi:hypothetical protein
MDGGYTGRWLEVDLGAVQYPDLSTVNSLMATCLRARRQGVRVRVRTTSSALAELLEFLGLDGVVRVEANGDLPSDSTELFGLFGPGERQPEVGKDEVGVEEERQTDDPAS